MTHADAQRLKKGEVNLGTSIMAVEFEGGVVIGADSRTTMGSYIANRVTDKLTHIHDRIYCCRSGSAADTQAVADIVAYHLSMFSVQQGERPNTHTAAALFNQLCYGNKDRLSAGIIVAGYDKENGGSVYNIPLGGGMFKQPWAIGGSGSTYVYGYCDATYKDGMNKDETVHFVKNTLALAMSRDGSSGGTIRMCVITDDGVQRLFVPGNELPQFWEPQVNVNKPAHQLAMEAEDNYPASTNNGPVILTIDGLNEESCETEYTMELDAMDTETDSLNVVDNQIDDIMAVDVHTDTFPSSVLILDTNILISNLDFLKSLHSLLRSNLCPPFGIVVPDIVIRELDAQKDSNRVWLNLREAV
ncbi:hypothetical protein E3P92_03192 [Wallemia ichthyophaga]|uniref:proteasome endopeptidase complex n=1 Tax=Wallemia ichthyophaga TaxID=245174 RepID=A0A4T0JBT8_WALIC|nr:hypothetical protein E3P98_01526 [Wallemia ichthyophaga]TIA88813.1 hypothetical protein E3P97_03365 [Wallemia ichthyophaga]TIA96797.1 hypothetical protein E3P95_03117 [Wallemia ichthyophaga]TIA98103.1 hypothetical protein E3P94_03077 [Wallemia ichthyophaga]TIB05832.1 hypothetical protein E3P96_00884 [Wallemia ichthyophaga]